MCIAAMTDTTHPIPKDKISNTLRHSEHSASEPGTTTNEELLVYHRLLAEIQRVLQDNLRSLVCGGYAGTRATGLTVFWESLDHYIFEDDERILKDALKTELQPDTSLAPVVRMHDFTAKWLVREFPELEHEAECSWVVAKPRAWYGAQWSLDRLFTHLIERGASPTQALDYWMIKVLGKRLVQWATVRGTTGQAIRDSIRAAEEALEPGADSASEMAYEPFQRTYRGQRGEGTTEVSADGHFVYPRREVSTYASSGKLTWGYRGAGPYQLAVALLADALETDDIPLEAVNEFVSFLNAESGDEDEWTLTQETIRAWVYAQTDHFD